MILLFWSLRRKSMNLQGLKASFIRLCPSDLKVGPPIAGLSQTARGIGRGRNMGSCGRRARICGDLVGRRLRQAYPDVHLKMLFGAARAKPLAGVFVAQAGKFIAAVDAVAISRRRSRLDRHQSHCVCPFQQDTTSATKFAQVPGGDIPTGRDVPQTGFNWDRRYGWPMFSRNSVQSVDCILTNTSTTFGSNCVPEHRWISSCAWRIDNALR